MKRKDMSMDARTESPIQRVAIVTGTSTGIGAALARTLVAAGVRVYGCSRSGASLQGSFEATVDLRDESAVSAWKESVAARESHVDLLVNNAGILGERRPFSDLSLDTWNEVISTNLLGTVTATRYFMPLMGGERSSIIINISSVMGRFGRAGWSPYVVSKFAIEGLTQVLAQEFMASGIRVVALHPPRLNTRLRREAYGEEAPFPPEHLDSLCAAVVWLLQNPDATVSGITLSSDDFASWSTR